MNAKDPLINLVIDVKGMDTIVRGLRLLRVKENNSNLDRVISDFEAVINEAIFRAAMSDIETMLQDETKCNKCENKETCFPKICNN